jgi:hypothetical protein
MSLAQRITQLTAALLSVSAPSCTFDTAPIFSPLAQDAGAIHALDASKPPVAREDVPIQPPVTLQPMAAMDAAPQMQPPPVVQAGAAPPPLPSPDAAVSGDDAAPPLAHCEGAGSYGLQLAVDLTWEATSALADPGRGTAKLYALVQVERVDPQTHALTAHGQVCGLTLPPFATSSSCQQHQFRFDDGMWNQPTLPPLQITGSYTCAADGCRLQIEPTTYALGIHLDPVTAPWPAPGSATADQFSDDDDDGSPGVSAEVVTQVGVVGNPSCAFLTGMQGGGAPMNMNQNQRLLLALRTQLSAAVITAADCHIDHAAGTVQLLDLRAAGCNFQSMGQPALDAGNTNCPDELRGAIDQSLPQYHVLATGEMPSATTPARDTTLSLGAQLSAIRFDPAMPVSCRQVRDAMF